jgi:peroxiredoxin
VGQAYGAARPADHDFAAFPHRVTFLISPTGEVHQVWKVSDVETHADEVLAAITAASG